MKDSFTETTLDVVELDMVTLDTVTGGCDEHGTPELPAPAASGSRRGSSDITALQKVLASIGFNPGRVDGILGPKTRRAIRAFQTRNRLKGDGVVGTQTRRALANYGLS